jgi:hypothetical protein
MQHPGNFYRLLADPAATSRWHVKSPLDPSGNEVDPRSFTQGVPVDSLLPLTLPLRRSGDEVDFNFCDFHMIVTPASVNTRLQAFAGSAIQRIPVAIDSRKGEFEILNVCDLVPCVDESRSLFTRWTGEDGRPDKVGQFRMIVKLKIDPAAAAGHEIIRVADWPIALIASENVKHLLEALNVSGLVYERVDLNVQERGLSPRFPPLPALATRCCIAWGAHW